MKVGPEKVCTEDREQYITHRVHLPHAEVLFRSQHCSMHSHGLRCRDARGLCSYDDHILSIPRTLTSE